MKIMMAHTLRRSCVVAALVGGFTALSVTAMAAAQVSGNPQAVSVDAQNSSIKDILTALAKQFNIRYQSTANLDKEVTGTYEGSLPRVVARLLEGYNFIITTNQDVIEVTVLGTQGPKTGVGPSQILASNAPAQPSQQTPLPAPPASGAVPAPSDRVAEVQQPRPMDKSASSPAPLPPFKVAESLTPTPSDSPTAGPVPGPATVAAPEPKPSGAGATPVAPPMPGPSTAELPMPTAGTAFPMSAATGIPTPSAASTAPPTPDTPASPKPPAAPATKQ